MRAKKVEEIGTEGVVLGFPQEDGNLFYAAGKPAPLSVNTDPDDFAQLQAADVEFPGEDEPDYDLTTYTDPVITENSPPYNRIALIFFGILSLLFCLLYFLEDTNGDAYIVNELVEYIMATEVISWITWGVGLGLNAIPNVPETLLLYSLVMLKLKDYYIRKRRAAQHQEREAEEDALSHEEFAQMFESERNQGETHPAGHLEHEDVHHNHAEHDHGHAHSHEDTTELVPTNKHHHKHEHTTAETLREIFLMGVTPGALGFAASYLVTGSLWWPWRLLISLVSGAVGGGADWVKHSYFNHEAEAVDDQHPLVRTFGTNLWATDNSVLWKLHQTWVKAIIMIHHGGSGLFNWYSVLSVTELADMIPGWSSLLIAGLLASPSFYYEGISETYAYDLVQQRPDFKIHSATHVSLILAGIIHSLSFGVLTAKIYQATPANNGPYYYLINSAIFALVSVLLVYPGTRGYYAMQKNPPVDDDGNQGLCTDDVIRLMVKEPRPDRQSMHYQLRANMQFWKRGEALPRGELLPEEPLVPSVKKTPLVREEEFTVAVDRQPPTYKLTIAPDDDNY